MTLKPGARGRLPGQAGIGIAVDDTEAMREQVVGNGLLDTFLNQRTVDTVSLLPGWTGGTSLSAWIEEKSYPPW